MISCLLSSSRWIEWLIYFSILRLFYDKLPFIMSSFSPLWTNVLCYWLVYFAVHVLLADAVVWTLYAYKSKLLVAKSTPRSFGDYLVNCPDICLCTTSTSLCGGSLTAPRHKLSRPKTGHTLRITVIKLSPSWWRLVWFICRKF